MNKNFNIFFLLLFIFFFVSIDSFPNRNLFRKREEEWGEFTQCPGDFPITYEFYKYSPKVLVAGKNYTQHLKWKTTTEIPEGTIGLFSAFDNDHKLVSTHKEDFCKTIAEHGEDPLCPIPPGEYESTTTVPLEASSEDPKGEEVEFFAKFEILSPDEKETLSCLEGKLKIQF